MAALVIFISSDLSDESVKSSILRVILIDDSESDTEMPERHVSPAPHAAMLARPCRALIARKSVRPLPYHRLPLRYTSHHLDHFTSGSSSDHSSSDHSSSGHFTLDHSSSGHSILVHFLFGYTPPVTTITDLSTPSRFVYSSLARTLRYREAYRHWRSASLSTMYPPTTSELSAGDSSSESSAGPSRKRCRSLAATVTSYIHASRTLVPSRVDLLPHRKRFRDSISLKDSVEEDNVEEDIDTDVLTDIEANAMAVEVAADLDIKAGVEAGIGMKVESSDRGTIEFGVDMVARNNIPDGMLMPDAVEHLDEVVQDIYRHVMEIPLQRVEDIETGHRHLEVESLIVGGERSSLLDQVASLERSNTRLRGTLMMESVRADRELMKLMTEVYYLRHGIQKTESELWNLTVKNNDLATYTQRFQELTMMCTKMVPEEDDRVKKFIGGLPDNIQGNVIAAEPTRLQDAVRIANNLMDQKLKGYDVKNAKNKRRAYMAGNNGKRGYARPLFYCNKCKLQHEGSCTVKYVKCNKVGHMPRDCMNDVVATATQRAQVVNQWVPTCFECGRQGHYRNECPKLKNQTRRNKAGKKTNEARGKAYMLEGG
nr:hypothetical protein [Tanacetum cinerariifolium]